MPSKFGNQRQPGRFGGAASSLGDLLQNAGSQRQALAGKMTPPNLGAKGGGASPPPQRGLGGAQQPLPSAKGGLQRQPGVRRGRPGPKGIF